MLTVKTVLHPTDFSACSAFAFQVACSVARDHGGRVLILHVTSVPDLAYTGFGAPVAPLEKKEYLAEAERNLDSIQPADRNRPVERIQVEGDPAEQIVRVAADKHADLIVIGTHGTKGLLGRLMGSVAESVVRAAPCPVLTVRVPEESR